MIMYTLLVYGLALLASCGSATPPKTAEKVTPYAQWSATVLENGTVTHVDMNLAEFMLHIDYDTVWVDLSTHTINDTSDAAMKCVLGKRIVFPRYGIQQIRK